MSVFSKFFVEGMLPLIELQVVEVNEIHWIKDIEKDTYFGKIDIKINIKTL